tara:strand:+ start:2485 stop:3234 length:750 start_codon:yes stop_codon:yes gene_type:complete
MFSITVNCQIRGIASGLSKIASITKPSKNTSQFSKIYNAAQNFSKSSKFDRKDLKDEDLMDLMDLIEKVLDDDDEKKNFQNAIQLNSSNNFKGIQFDSKFNNKKKLVRDYRQWANSTDELSHKFGKPSNYDLDAIGSVNSYFYRSYAAGKKEFHKIYPLENYDLEEKDLINVYDIFVPYVEKDFSKIFIEYEKPDLSLNSMQGKTSNGFEEDLFLKFLKSKSAIDFENRQNTMDLSTKYDKTIIWKLTP